MSVKYGYVPLHPPQKDVSFERMQEILAKNSAKAAQSPKEKSGLIEWQKPSRTGEGTAQQMSVCGRYRIDRVASQMSVGYTCWRKSSVPGVLNERLGCTDNADAARAMCQADADKVAP